MFTRDSNIQKGLGVILIVGLCLLGLVSGFAGENRAMSGWELNSPYNKLYKASDMDSFKGTVVDIKEVVPLPGMSPGLALEVSESKGETITVHLCPSSFENKKSIRIKKGDRVKVAGVWAEINKKDIFMGSKVTKGDYSLKVRLTQDGTPFWTMTPSQLAKERQDQ
ncbi:MAG: hypothetical protein D4R56_01565 [Deltaproteobacteria bacterium]|nr:MAG: hypothetical protein D4R56_01565 [Deltaproteobacteria bacterium]